MNPNRTSQLCTAISFVLLAACSSDNLTSSTSAEIGPPLHPRSNIIAEVSDNCANDAGSCHNGVLAYSDANYSCPEGSHTFPILPYDQYRTQVSAAIARITTSQPGCQIYKDYLTRAMSEGRLRYYNDWDWNWGDTHFHSGVGPDYDAKIHIFDGTFHTTDGGRMLAVTLVHEAWHAYWRSYDETAADGTAEACIP